MKFLLLFVSPNGTTKKTTIVLKNTMEKYNHEVNLIDIGCKSVRENYNYIFENIISSDIIGFGSPAYHMDMLEPMKKLLFRLLEESRNNTFNFRAFLYLNYAGITAGKAFENAGKILSQMNIPIIGAMRLYAPHLHHKEAFPSPNTIAFIGDFFQALEKKNFISIDNKLLLPEKKRVKLLYPLAHIIGKKRELPINIDNSKCKYCKKCLSECPVGAITSNSSIDIDFTYCIHCYHCTVCCPFGAINCRTEKLDDMIRLNKKIMGMEKPVDKMYI